MGGCSNLFPILFQDPPVATSLKGEGAMATCEPAMPMAELRQRYEALGVIEEMMGERSRPSSGSMWTGVYATTQIVFSPGAVP